jgi:transcriptional regulator with XRE-family HTH domain
MGKKYLELGKKLKILRGKRTQTDVAVDIGTTLRAYQYYEAGEREPDSKILQKISALYGKSIDWLLNDDNSVNINHVFAEPPRHPAAAFMPVPDLNPPPGVDPTIQAMADIKEIMDSRDPILIPAIQANLHAFKRALLRERQFEQLLRENEELKERILKLENLVAEIKDKFEDLQAENHALRTENNRLKSTYEDPNGDNGHPTTDTEKKAM